MKLKFALFVLFIILGAAFTFGQRPGSDGTPESGRSRPEMGTFPQWPQYLDWVKGVDTDKNGSIDSAEFQAAIDATFAKYDLNKDGILSPEELKRTSSPRGWPGPPRTGDPKDVKPPEAQQPKPPEASILPSFFFIDKVKRGESLTRTQFDGIVRGVFTKMDKDSDGSLSKDETKPASRSDYRGREDWSGGMPQMPPNAMFIGAELRFGDKVIKSKPFSADILIEDDRRLYDGTIIRKQSNGVVYRDSAGRTRREQPFPNVGGVKVVGSDSAPQVMIYINDIVAGTQIYLDHANKSAYKVEIGDGRSSRSGKMSVPNTKSESLGVKTIEGVSAEGTRTVFEIPAGHIGNSQPIQVIDEQWFSPDLGVTVLSRHVDPLIGEHVFKLVNIKQAEPSADLFTVPSGYKVNSRTNRRHED